MADADETRASAPGVRPTDAIGPYKLLQQIGEGGMGVVWLAEQSRPVRRKVALKIIKAGMDTAQVVARFEAERQALAMMDHPAIARVLEAGATLEGRPYFVMEYVRGESLTAYCTLHKLSVRDRLDLFLQVCDGVQHAHQKGIIHRDLKPSNVLVMVQGDRAVPKIIDFGVAKATATPLTDRTLHTELGTFIGTPEYMSPEQAEMSGLDVDTRTDVYSLGAILYELLTGAMPFESKTLREMGLDEIRRTLREVDPPKPSTRVVAPALKGDLDWITMKALEKDRTRRYGSASDLAADIRRHLDDQPVLAGPPSTMYRVGKFVRRHRGGVAAAAAVALLLVGFGVTMAIQASRLARERDRANQEQAAAKAVSDFLRFDVLEQASAWSQTGPGVKPDPDIKVRTALDRAATRIAGRFTDQPFVESAIRQTIGATYGELGLYEQAKRHLEQAIETGRRVGGDEGEATLRGLDALARLFAQEGNSEEAARRYLELHQIYTRRYGPKHPDVIRTMNNIASNEYNSGKRDKAEDTFKQLLPLEREVVGPDAELTLASMHSLARIYLDRGAWKEAEPLLSEALATSRRVNGDEHPRTMTMMDLLAQTFGQQGRYAEAETIRRQVLDSRLRALGPEALAVISARGSLAQNLINQDQPAKRAEAERLLSENLAASRRVHGEHHPATNNIRVNLANLYQETRRYTEAESLLRTAAEDLRKAPGPGRPATVGALESLGTVLIQLRKYADAERVLHEAIKARDALAPNGWQRFDNQSLLGASFAGQRRFEEAERLLVAGYEGLKQRADSIPAYNREVLGDSALRLVDLYTAWGKPAQAAEWRRRAAE